MRKLQGAMWAAAFLLFMIAFQSNSAVEIAIDTAISGGLDMPQISVEDTDIFIENTYSDIWSELNVKYVCLCEVNILKWPQIAGITYKLFAFDSYNEYWIRRINASKNKFIA